MKKGFTLIEIVVCVAIIILLTAFTTSAFVSVENSQSVDKTANALRSMVEKAHEETVASSGNSAYGIYFTPTSATLFEGTAYAAGNKGNQVLTFNGVTLSQINLTGGADDVVFARVTGTASVSGTLVLTSTGRSTDHTTLTLYSSGIIQ